jgi:16S rRNA (guanine527-N7)-methyltransferase
MKEWQALINIWTATLNWQPTSKQQQQFDSLYQLILEGNRQFNLTRITEPLDFWEKHLWDSLAPIFYNKLLLENKQVKVIDIGTGAGFPAIPLAIVFPNWQFTLLDSTRKKMTFVDSLSSALNLDNLKTVVNRAETIGQDKTYRNQYDLALIRAVAEASVCAEYSLPLLNMGGIALLYRGKWTEEEQETLESALKTLGGKSAKVHSFETPLTQSIRHCIYLEKIAKTPTEFPRAVGIPTQKPL